MAAAVSCARPAPTANPGEVEATEFEGTLLTPIARQLNNALEGTQVIDRSKYRLIVTGLVDAPLALTYDNLTSFSQQSWLMDLNCVEGWSFTAKWTGPRLMDILDQAGVKPEATVVIFHTADVPEGYSSLDLSYIRDNGIILGLRLNDVTLPVERGFPFQVVAKNKYGYKWAKWVTEIELSSDRGFRGFWESRGYSNTANLGESGFVP
jgi:DMSO/TMAO reductase YedYZ molybdopterin-dependent catalytic subunit